MHDLMRNLVSLARRLLARFTYFLKDGFNCVCSHYEFSDIVQYWIYYNTGISKHVLEELASFIPYDVYK